MIAGPISLLRIAGRLKDRWDECAVETRLTITTDNGGVVSTLRRDLTEPRGAGAILRARLASMPAVVIDDKAGVKPTLIDKPI
jgi:hypothetical protein